MMATMALMNRTATTNTTVTTNTTIAAPAIIMSRPTGRVRRSPRTSFVGAWVSCWPS